MPQYMAQRSKATVWACRSSHTHLKSPTAATRPPQGKFNAVHGYAGLTPAAVLECDPCCVRPLDEAERMLSLQLALKVADLGHLAAQLPVHERCVKPGVVVRPAAL